MSLDAYPHILDPGAPGGAIAFGFHGTGGDERQFAPLLRQLLPEATIVAPRGDVSERGAARFFKRRAEGVYDMDDLARATDKMAGFVEAHVAATKPSRVIGLGYSNGANILASLIFARPDLFDDAGLMHPYIPWDPAPAPLRARILITAGERDPICPPEDTRRLATWFADQGASFSTDWTPGGHEIAQAEVDAIAGFLAATRETSHAD